jgi:hypothetical protein
MMLQMRALACGEFGLMGMAPNGPPADWWTHRQNGLRHRGDWERRWRAG